MSILFGRRFGVLRVVGQRQRERNGSVWAASRSHLRPDVEKSGHDRRHLE